ncbi:DUF3794 and LysM peptidoglycan-binding domain-containing protein [Desulforamulus hydrothermalis]|uniref:Peptidoglycan-binding lysin domain protein n=1 Tax=Desulforamulus hydrothermalis Lam5 = DSM 18033 TaxID=1121428 RepID=K8DZN5_9FIRM|nr:SPOCS domain-containing protein [Desulforamulus hydrothermalis]CCO08584.1 Peptidoglycan-binding lysin domain protein [Desulforamulus hydrothermalis Lam5 = DSM 18033]SHH01698.1 LysM domain-containing protein [Desulforamulus hydrothermalis Lam5 = DSM 18033]
MATKKGPKPKFRRSLDNDNNNNNNNNNAALETERFSLEEVVGENTEQTIVRGTISVPQAKPEVEEILSTDTSTKLRKVEIIPNKVIVEGTLKLEVMYTAFKVDQAVHTFHAELDFTDFIEVEGARPGMNVEVDIVVEDVSLTRDAKCAEDWDVAAVLKVTARVTETRDVNVLTECPQGYNCETERMNLQHTVGTGTKQVLIDDEFEVPDGKPDVEKFIKCMCDVEITDTKIIKNKVLIEGEVDLECIYTAMKEDQSVHTLHETFKFNTFIEVVGAEQGMNVQVDAMVESCDVEVAETNACKLSPTIVLRLRARVTEDREVDVITDIEDADVDTVTLDMKSLVGEGCKQVVVRDAQEPPSEKPAIDKIKEVTAGDVVIKDTDVIRDKVLVKGTVEFQVLYTAMKADQSVHMIHRKVAFKTFIDVPGARPDNDVDIDVEVEWANAKTDGCDLVLEAVLNVCARVTETVEREVVTGFRPRPTPTPTPTPTAAPEVCVPGTTFNYVVQRGDTLSKLAQRYGTTVQAILAVNPQITNPNLITVGQTIKIPCVAKG